MNAPPSSPEPEEIFLLPGGYSLEWLHGGVQFRNGAPGVPAQVTAILLTAADVPAPV